MNTSELRQGNFFYKISRKGEVHLPIQIPFKVVEINAFEVAAVLADKHPATEKQWAMIASEDISPIPLSPEWFKKFNCPPNGTHHYFFPDGTLVNFLISVNKTNLGIDYSIVTKREPGDHRIGLSKPFKYVHQFQNIFHALASEELIYST